MKTFCKDDSHGAGTKHSKYNVAEALTHLAQHHLTTQGRVVAAAVDLNQLREKLCREGKDALDAAWCTGVSFSESCR